MQAHRPSSRALCWLVLAFGLSACKPAAGTQAPQTRLDDIASIEYELSANASRLEAQGLSVPATTTPSPTAGADDGATKDEYAQPESPTTAEGAEPPPPAPESAPEPEPEPMLDEDDAPSYSPERDSSDVRRVNRRERKRSSRATKPKTRCERICDLADSTCDLADRICALADEHVDDVRYEQACERAETQCELASDACSECVD